MQIIFLEGKLKMTPMFPKNMEINYKGTILDFCLIESGAPPRSGQRLFLNLQLEYPPVLA